MIYFQSNENFKIKVIPHVLFGPSVFALYCEVDHVDFDYLNYFELEAVTLVKEEAVNCQQFNSNLIKECSVLYLNFRNTPIINKFSPLRGTNKSRPSCVYVWIRMWNHVRRIVISLYPALVTFPNQTTIVQTYALIFFWAILHIILHHRTKTNLEDFQEKEFAM